MLDTDAQRARQLDAPEQPVTDSTRRACTHCQSPSATLFSLGILNRRAQRIVIDVCRFCYLHLAGVQPRRGDLNRVRLVK